mmetsp:Transcript_61517/g.97119  ORF Transcript_61517/g.97119 Transcript_61517/m.97119 type:complete len:81 (-) Transcript_61517:322-564(-)
MFDVTSRSSSKQQLLQYLVRGKIAIETKSARCAELAGHSASHLRRDAECCAMLHPLSLYTTKLALAALIDDDAFDLISIV